MSTQQDINAIRAQRLANAHDLLALMENIQTPFHPDQSSPITYLQHPQPNNNFVPQPSFSSNYMQQPMQNPKDISNPTTAIDMELVLMAKALTLNDTTPTNNNQRSSSNPSNMQIAQPGMNMDQDRQMLMVEDNVGNQFRPNAMQNVGNQAEANGNGINGNQIRCYNCQGVDHYTSNCTVKPRKRDAAYLQKHMQIAQKEEAGIQLTCEEFYFMAAVGACEETERGNENCTLENNLQQASTSGTQSDKAPVYDSNGSAEVHLSENCYDNDIFNMFTQEEQYTELIEPIPEPHQVQQNDSNVISVVSSVEQGGGTVEQHSATIEETQADESLAKHKALELEIERLLRAVVSQYIMSIVQNPAVVESSDLQTELEHTLDPLSQKLENENMELEYQVSEQKDTTKGMSVNTQFCKKSILGKSPSSYGSKLYSVTPFPKSKGLPKIDESHALSKPVTSNSAPSSRESNVVNNEKVIAPGIFRINPFKASRYVNGMKSRKKNQSANVSKSANQKKNKENVKKLKKSGSKESLASPSKPRSFLRWLPTGRIFDFYGKITSSSNIKSESDTSVCDNASASNPQEPTNKGFPSSTSFLDRFTRLPRQNTCIHPLAVL
ncbi:hypothetical protein Tco_0004315 [Tanacetum coccineum]